MDDLGTKALKYQMNQKPVEVDNGNFRDALMKVYSGVRSGSRKEAVQGLSEYATGVQSSILERMGQITQRFGQQSDADIFSGGVNYGTDIAVPRGTKVAAPKGKWKVVEAYNQAVKEGSGKSNRAENRGYGNSVLLQNVDTGEKLRFSHLRSGGVNVAPGQLVIGGQVIAETGASGNVAGRTGQHLDLEYYDQKGKISDVQRSPYWEAMGGGNPFAKVGESLRAGREQMKQDARLENELVKRMIQGDSEPYREYASEKALDYGMGIASTSPRNMYEGLRQANIASKIPEKERQEIIERFLNAKDAIRRGMKTTELTDDVVKARKELEELARQVAKRVPDPKLKPGKRAMIPENIRFLEGVLGDQAAKQNQVVTGSTNQSKSLNEALDKASDTILDKILDKLTVIRMK